MAYKVPNHIKNKELLNYAINDDGTVDVMVLFYNNVTFDEAKE